MGCSNSGDSPANGGGYPDGPRVTRAGEERKAGLWGHSRGRRWGSGASGGADAAFARGRSATPGPGGWAETRGPWLPWRRAGRGDSCPAPSPAGPPAQMVPASRGSRRPAAGEAIVLLPRRRSPAARARAPPRAPPPPAPRPPCGSRPVTAPARRLPCARPPPPAAAPRGRAAGAATAGAPPPAALPPVGPALRTKVGAGARARLSRPAGRCALCRRARAARSGSGSGSGRVGGAGTGGCSPGCSPPSGSRGQDGESSASQVPVCGRWGSRRAGRGPFSRAEKSLEELGLTNALEAGRPALRVCDSASCSRRGGGPAGAGPGAAGALGGPCPEAASARLALASRLGAPWGAGWASSPLW